MKNYEDELDKLRIHELRDLARKMGVQSPTTLKKEEIINNVMEILSGKKEPYVSSSKQGRPARNQEKTISIQDLFDGKEGCTPYVLNHTSRSYTLSQPHATYVNDLSYDEKDVSGYLDVNLKRGYIRSNGYLPGDNDVIVPLELIKEKNLKSGVLVKAKYCDKQNKVKDIKFLNESELDFEKAKSVMLNRKINVNTLKNIFFGGKYYIEKSDNKQMYDFVFNTASEINKNSNCIVKLVYIDAMEELIIQKDESIEALILPFNKTPEEIVSAVNLFIEKSKRDVETQQDVVVLVCGFANLIKYFNLVQNNYSMSNVVDYGALINVKNLISSAKNINENSSLTLITCQTNRMPAYLSEIVEFELKPLFNEIY